ncbi:MAG: putative anti-sigma factor antagonist BtrV [Chlamydiia bacterium]|nr:putative anti-sigma factor antagonist BtrV [Chlamydiia bacterium]
MSLNIEEKRVGSVLILRLEGRIDAVSSGILDKSLTEVINKQHDKIALDFTKVDYLSSAGMRLLLSVTKKMKASDGMLCIFSVHDDVMEIIRMAGFERILTLYPLEKDALNALKESSE